RYARCCRRDGRYRLCVLPHSVGLTRNPARAAPYPPAPVYTTQHPRHDEDRAPLIAEVRAALGASAPRIVLVRSPEIGADQAFERWAANIEVDRLAPISGARNLDPLEIAVTSGSTGDPKGVLHVHDSAIATVDSTIARQKIGPSDIVHLAVPVGHTF